MNNLNLYIFDWRSKTVDSVTETHAICFGEKRRVLLRLFFPQYFYIQLPKVLNRETIVDDLKLHVSENELDVKLRTTMTKMLYGYQQSSTYPVILATSMKEKDIMSFKKYVKQTYKESLQIWEDEFSLNPRKLTSAMNTTLSSYISISHDDLEEVSSDERLTQEMFDEYKCDWTKIKVLSHEDGEKIEINPMILSFDIECYKPSSRGGMPDPEERDNYIFYISMIFQRLQEPSSREKISIVIGDVDYSYFPKDCICYETKDEKELLERFLTILNDHHPSFIVGYNTHSWDWNYINKRMRFYKMTWPDDIGMYSREKIKMREIMENTIYGSKTLTYPDITGSIIFDLFLYMKHNNSGLQKHSLQFVSEYFLGRGKYPVSQDMMVNAFETKNIDDYSKVGQYNLEDSNLVLDLMMKLDVFSKVKNMAMFLNSTMESIYVSGQQTRAFNNIYGEAKKNGFVVNRIETEHLHLRGALVLEPLKGFHNNVIKLDINSLYPSLLNAYNICYSTFLTKEQALKMNVDDYHALEYVKTDGERVNSYFVKASIQKGVTVSISEHMISLRKKYKTLSKDTSLSDCERAVYKDIEQSFKLSINSIIGLMEMDERFAKLPFLQGAGTIKTMGRKLLMDMRDFVESAFGRVIYGDTDSLFLLVDNNDNESLADIGRRIEKKINEKFKPFRIEFEDAGYCLLIEKKMYVFWPVDNKNEMLSEKDVIYRGIATVRRDTCRHVCKVMKSILISVFEKISKEDAITLLINEVADLLSGNVPIENLTMTKKTSDKESFVSIFAKRERERGKGIISGDSVEYTIVKDPNKGTTKVSERMMSPEEFHQITKTTNSNLQIDERYFLEKMEKCIDNIFDVHFGGEEVVTTKTKSKSAKQKKKDAEEDTEEILSEKGIDTEGFICKSNRPVKAIIQLIKDGKLEYSEMDRIRKLRLKKINKRLQDGEKLPREVLKIVISE